MQLETIAMPKTEARKAFLAYRDAVKDHRGRSSDQVRTDEHLMRAYRELARGHQLIRLSEALAAGGTTTVEWERWGRSGEIEVPLLACTRADAAFAYTDGIRDSGALTMRGKENIGPSNRRDRVDVPAGTFARGERSTIPWGLCARAMAPLIPPHFRPKRGSLGLYHVLWGPAEWQVHDVPPPPGDPALLRQIDGDLYAVVAIWDLTPVEQAVLGGLRG